MKTTVLNFDEVVLVKELNNKIKKVGETFEVANILDGSFLLRDAKTKVALGIVNFEDFEKHFVHKENFKGWTQWCPLAGFDGQTDAFYRTNMRKVQVKFLTDKVRAEACCNKVNEFNLAFGLQMAYLRCLNKSMMKKSAMYEEALKKIDIEVADNMHIIKKMYQSLEV